MTDTAIPVLPYSQIIGQDQIKRALSATYIAEGIGGVLITGQRGTAKSTAVRAFARMAHGRLPVTLPLNATDDRVIGGYRLDVLMRGDLEWQPGLLEEADGGVLYVDEVNLLDDHIVNLILDVASTGVLPIQHEGQDKLVHVEVALVGTMNPEEGGLRPQLLDRFGLLVDVTSENSEQARLEILEAALAFDDATRTRDADGWLSAALEEDARQRATLIDAKERYRHVDVPAPMRTACARIATRLDVAGHRGDIVLALTARALAALEAEQAGVPEDEPVAVCARHVRDAAPLALVHRSDAVKSEKIEWKARHADVVDDILGRA